MIQTRSISHEEYLRKKRKKKLWKVGLFIFFILLVIGLISYGSHRKEVRISKVELNGGILVTQSDIESKTLTYLYGSYFWLFPKGNIFWYPHSELENYLKDTFKRIDKIEIQRKDFQTLVMNIMERKPFAIWCEGVPVGENVNDEVNDLINQQERPSESAGSTEDTSPQCYFIDQNSTVFAKAPTFSGDAYIKYYGLISLVENELPFGKEYIASSTEFSEISGFILKVKELSLRPQYLLAKENREFSLVLSGGGEIYFDMGTPLSTVGKNLEALLRTPTFASSTGGLPVEYIDLRYGNKLFYKLKQ